MYRICMYVYSAAAQFTQTHTHTHARMQATHTHTHTHTHTPAQCPASGQPRRGEQFSGELKTLSVSICTLVPVKQENRVLLYLAVFHSLFDDALKH